MTNSPCLGGSQAAATSGDGYRGQTSPHTPSEKFYGVTVFKALKVGSALCSGRGGQGARLRGGAGDGGGKIQGVPAATEARGEAAF